MQRGTVLADPRDHLGREPRGPGQLELAPRRVEQTSQHLESQGIGLVTNGAPYDPDAVGGARLAHGRDAGVCR